MFQCLHSAIQRNYGFWFKTLGGIRADLKIAMKPSGCSFSHVAWELAPHVCCCWLPLSPLNSEEQGGTWSYKWKRMSLGREKGSFG